MTAVEVTTKYATSRPTLPEAWAFVMGHVDLVGDAPSVRIAPVWACEGRTFEVVVEGMVEVAP